MRACVYSRKKTWFGIILYSIDFCVQSIIPHFCQFFHCDVHFLVEEKKKLKIKLRQSNDLCIWMRSAWVDFSFDITPGALCHLETTVIECSRMGPEYDPSFSECELNNGQWGSHDGNGARNESCENMWTSRREIIKCKRSMGFESSLWTNWSPVNECWSLFNWQMV